MLTLMDTDSGESGECPASAAPITASSPPSSVARFTIFSMGVGQGSARIGRLGELRGIGAYDGDGGICGSLLGDGIAPGQQPGRGQQQEQREEVGPRVRRTTAPGRSCSCGCRGLSELVVLDYRLQSEEQGRGMTPVLSGPSADPRRPHQRGAADCEPLPRRMDPASAFCSWPSATASTPLTRTVSIPSG